MRIVICDKHLDIAFKPFIHRCHCFDVFIDVHTTYWFTSLRLIISNIFDTVCSQVPLKEIEYIREFRVLVAKILVKDKINQRLTN